MTTFPNLAGVATADLVEQIGTGKFAADPPTSVNELHRLFRLDPESGRLYWRVRTAKRTRIGDEAGALNKRTGYRHVRVAGRIIATHRVVYAMANGALPRLSIDHINGDRLDNRPCNLREATPWQQAANKAPQANNKSGAPGVQFQKASNKWMARIQHRRRQIYLGLFASIDDAKEFRDLAASMLFGEFIRSTR